MYVRTRLHYGSLIISHIGSQTALDPPVSSTNLVTVYSVNVFYPYATILVTRTVVLISP